MKQISQLTYMNLLSTYENDPQFKDFISKLSNQYKKYKDTRHLKLESKKSFNLIESWWILISDYEFDTKLHYVKIMFKTPKFERITKDRAAKFVDMLSAIGGTIGLLTGFSIISGIEIIYFTIKIIRRMIEKCFDKNAIKKL